MGSHKNLQKFLPGLNRPDVKNFLVLGMPVVTNYASELVITESELLSALPAFVLVPLEISSDKSFFELIFSFNIDVLEPVQDPEKAIPILFFTRTPPVITFDVSHEVSPSIFESALQFGTQLIEVLQALNLQEKAVELVRGISSILGIDFENTSGFTGFLKSIALAAAGRMLGYTAMFPRVWRGCDVSQNYKFTVHHHVWHFGSKHNDELYGALRAFGSFIFPRSISADLVMEQAKALEGILQQSSQSTESGSSTEANAQKSGSPPPGQQTEGMKQEQNNESVRITDFMFKYPFFCRLIDARTGQVLINAGLVTSATIELDYNNTMWDGTPAIINIDFSVQPLMPLILNTVTASEHKKGIMSLKDWASMMSNTKMSSSVDKNVFRRATSGTSRTYRF